MERIGDEKKAELVEIVTGDYDKVWIKVELMIWFAFKLEQSGLRVVLRSLLQHSFIFIFSRGQSQRQRDKKLSGSFLLSHTKQITLMTDDD